MKFFRFFLQFLFKLLPKFSDFINSDDCIVKITSKSIRIYPVFIQKRLNLFKKGIIFSEKIKNSSNYIHIYMIMLTRCLERIFNPSHYTGIIYIGFLFYIYFQITDINYFIENIYICYLYL